ncbi:MAG: adaptor protein MecA [Blautia sp.]|nr:adaptor protein MecA [Blautia sp.]MDY5032273.1 adaptor protein MecA [Blautia sp.]
MKIEKINENQIRCTLTREDLADHQIRISELAYGSEKAKRLFRDMMHQAQVQFGFETDNLPLMIEAIPVNMESIILIITKVSDPEELDTRFSKFAPFKGDSAAENTIQFDGADNIIDIFQKLYEAKLKSQASSDEKKSPDAPAEQSSAEKQEEPAPSVDLIRLFSFRNLDDVIRASHGLNNLFQGENTLYKELPSGHYMLVLHQTNSTPEDFNKVCNILSEYGSGKAFSQAGEAYLCEHGEIIVSGQAIQQLAKL